MKVVNLSAEAEWQLHSWLPKKLAAETVVFLPDACPGKSPLPTGTATLTHQSDWRRFAVSDCGCGMRLVRSPIKRDKLERRKWNALAELMRQNKGKLGDLGGGNHFVDALSPCGTDELFFLIHTGSRDESTDVENFVDEADRFDAEFARVCQWAVDNRRTIQEAINCVFGQTQLVLDINHNSFEKLPTGGVIIRKGAVRTMPGDLCIIPSHMAGDAALCRATDRIGEALFSMSHGTGRTMSRSDAKGLCSSEQLTALRERLLLPDDFNLNSLRTEGPYAYRDLDDCLLLIDGFVELVQRFEVLAYLGHL